MPCWPGGAGIRRSTQIQGFGKISTGLATIILSSRGPLCSAQRFVFCSHRYVVLQIGGAVVPHQHRMNYLTAGTALARLAVVGLFSPAGGVGSVAGLSSVQRPSIDQSITSRRTKAGRKVLQT